MSAAATSTAVVPQLAAPSATNSPANTKSTASSDWDFSFHNLLDIINPLQHLPVIGTLYRAITGSHIGIPEKIAGDALYGGVWGAVSGVADAAFEAVTGKDFGSTVLALFQGSHQTQLAQVTVTPAAQLPSTSTPTPAASTPVASASSAATAQNSAALKALQSSLSRQGVDTDLAQRAIAAYRKSITLPALVPQAAS
jgi:hypothetical protein